MEYHFLDREELYQRVKPALRCRSNIFFNEGFEVKEFEIWNSLIINKWKNSNGLMLCDVVSDIMHISKDEIETYRNNKSSQDLDNLEII